MEIRAVGYGDELVAVLSAAAEALREVPGSVHRLSSAELSAVLTAVDEVAALAGAARFTVTAQAVDRGEVAASQAGSTQQWVGDRCRSLDAREAGVVAKAVRELADPRTADPRLAAARDAVHAGRLSVPAGCVVASEWRQLVPLVEPAAAEAVVAGLVEIGVLEGVAGVRALRPALLARYGLGEQLQDREDRQRGLTMLSCGRDIGGGIHEYRMRLATEARALLEAAINAASAPQPADGERDPRTVEQRRGDALVDVCRRAVAYSAPGRRADGAGSARNGDGDGSSGESGEGSKSTGGRANAATGRSDESNDSGSSSGGYDEASDSGSSGRPGGSAARATGTHGASSGPSQDGRVKPPRGVKATVIVTIGLEALRDRSGAGVLLGGVDGGTLLGPETVRRLACDGAVIPVVVGVDGQILHFGRTERWFTAPQIKALWLRDRHCTFPGCRKPASWCDAHHIQHWVDGGPTDLSNGALLCERHHTIVHRDRLAATVTGDITGSKVTWDRTPGSYDEALARGPTARPAA